jgi:hypothetical protein
MNGRRYSRIGSSVMLHSSSSAGSDRVISRVLLVFWAARTCSVYWPVSLSRTGTPALRLLLFGACVLADDDDGGPMLVFSLLPSARLL